jgi:hypothetical protein
MAPPVSMNNIKRSLKIIENVFLKRLSKPVSKARDKEATSRFKLESNVNIKRLFKCESLSFKEDIFNIHYKHTPMVKEIEVFAKYFNYLTGWTFATFTGWTFATFFLVS